jgi:hypothetical protein
MADFSQQVVIVERREGLWAALRRLLSRRRGIEWLVYWDGSPAGLYASVEALLASIAGRRRAMASLGFTVDLDVVLEPSTPQGRVVADVLRRRFPS